MRPVLPWRIVALCKAKARNFKRKIPGLDSLPTPQLLSTEGTQSQLGNFGLGIAAEEVEEDAGESQKSRENADKQEELLKGDHKPRGIIYARVSSEKQLKGEDENSDTEFDEGSIEGQIEELTELANKEGIELPFDPITDEAQSGTDFDRDGIQEVFEVCKRENIDYLLVEKVDRIGRSAPETLYFIYVLQSECDVMLLTPSGERDLDQVEGLMQTTLLSLMAEVQNEIRTTKAKKERIRGFLKKKNWKCKSPKIPLGYEETEDGWLEVNPDEKKIVRDLFRKFVNCHSYLDTHKYIDEKYGQDTLEGHQVKTLLTNSVYIGRPRLPEEWITETTFENDLEDQSLHLLQKDESADIDVSEEIFRETQEIIREKDEKHASDDDTDQLLDFIEEFGLFAVIEGSDPATLLHHCGEPMVTDGQRDLKGRNVHRYRCRNCEEKVDAPSYYRQWPRDYELDKIEMIHDVVEGDSDYFEKF